LQRLEQQLAHSKTSKSSSSLNQDEKEIQEQKKVERNIAVFTPSDRPAKLDEINLPSEERESEVNETEFKEFASIAPGENWLLKGKENEILTKKKREKN